ncbi:MAG: hypothetical protein JWM89_496 [Acidimicrobiales bacterium]|nr:hypothetical protein [Acidimicrobiales bacterium]
MHAIRHTAAPILPVDASAAAGMLEATRSVLTVNDIPATLIRRPARDGRGLLEADLLVHPDREGAAESVLAAMGFRRLPGWGRAPHRFFVAPVASTVDPMHTLDWLKLDIVDDLCFGRTHEIATRTGAACLDEALPAHPGLELGRANEFAALLLHCVLDVSRIDPRHQERLQELASALRGHDEGGALVGACREVDEQGPTWDELVAAAAERRWLVLLRADTHLRRRLIAHRRFSTAVRHARSTASRHATKALTVAAARGRTVALVGPDGTGKSTLASALAASTPVPTRVLYGGTYTSATPSSPVPGIATLAVLRRLAATRAAAAYHRARGRMVVLDRHPEECRPAPGDGLGAKARLRRGLLAGVLPAPDLMLVLDAPADVLRSRRPEHTVAHLEDDRTRHLRMLDGDRTVLLDASPGAADVRNRAVELVWKRAVGLPVLHLSGARR